MAILTIDYNDFNKWTFKMISLKIGTIEVVGI